MLEVRDLHSFYGDAHEGVAMWTGAEILDWYKAQTRGV